MGMLHQFVETHNTRSNIEAKRDKLASQIREARMVRITEAKNRAWNNIQSRRAEICDLINISFHKIPWKEQTVFQVPRSFKTLAKAYATAENLARIGGEDYNEAVKVLRFSRTSHDAYVEACQVAQIDLVDSKG